MYSDATGVKLYSYFYFGFVSFETLLSKGRESYRTLLLKKYYLKYCVLVNNSTFQA